MCLQRVQVLRKIYVIIIAVALVIRYFRIWSCVGRAPTRTTARRYRRGTSACRKRSWKEHNRKKASNIVITQISLERLSENSADVIACSQEQTREIGVVNRDAMSWALSTFSTNNNVTNEQLPQVLQEAEDDSDK